MPKALVGQSNQDEVWKAMGVRTVRITSIAHSARSRPSAGRGSSAVETAKVDKGSGCIRVEIEQSEPRPLILRHLLGRRHRREAAPVGSLDRHAKDLLALGPVAKIVAVPAGGEAMFPARAERRRADDVEGSGEAGQRICDAGWSDSG